MKLIKAWILVFCLLIIYNLNESFGQEKINVVLGIDLPDLLNCGILLQHNQIQYGINVGGFIQLEILLEIFFHIQ